MKNEISEIEIAKMVKCLQKIAGKSTHGWRIAAADRLGVSEGTVRNAERGKWSAAFRAKVEGVLTATRDGADVERAIGRAAGSWAVGEPVDSLRRTMPHLAGEAVVTRMSAPRCIIYITQTFGGIVEHKIDWLDDVQREDVSEIVEKGVALGVEHIRARVEYEHREEDRRVAEMRSRYAPEDVTDTSWQQLVNSHLSLGPAQVRALRDRLRTERAEIRSNPRPARGDLVDLGRLEMLDEMLCAAERDDDLSSPARMIVATYAEKPTARLHTPRQEEALRAGMARAADMLKAFAREELPSWPEMTGLVSRETIDEMRLG